MPTLSTSETKKRKPLKVTFIKDFQGQLNAVKFDYKKGDSIEIKKSEMFLIEWLKKHKAIL